MSALLWIDGLWAEFHNSLSGALRDEARRLSFTLGLAPEPFVPWSHVFSHEVTLAAPAMFAEAMPGLPESVVEHALFAHALAVIEAMGTDRVEDGQVEDTAGLRKVLAALRRCRDEQLALVAAAPDPSIDPAAADRELLGAIRLERELLAAGGSVDFGTYEDVSRHKQAPGMVASAALAARAGWSPAKRAMLRRTLLATALGLQLYDDVVDWEDDARRGRSWALALARPTPAPAPRRGGAPDSSRSRAEVHAAGVLSRMLRRARFHFHAAARRARVLGARRFAIWAEQRATSLGLLADREAQNAGYVNRAHALAPWARAVLLAPA